MKLYGRIKGIYHVCDYKKSIPQKLEGATSYYVRGTNPTTGKPKNFPVGPDFETAKSELFRMMENGEPTEPKTTAAPGARVTLKAAAETYLENCIKKGRGEETMGLYRNAVNSFLEHCGVTYVDEISKSVVVNGNTTIISQPLLDYLGWLRKQPIPKRKNGNPDRTIANKVERVKSFLKSVGHSRLLEKLPFRKKIIIAHTEDELTFLYTKAKGNPEITFLLDFFIGTMARDCEGYGKFGHPQLSGTTLTLYGKQHKNRTVEISPKLAAAIRARREQTGSECLFLSRRDRKPNKHLLRDFQNWAEKKALAKFHTELHKLRKTGASRRYLEDRPLMTLMGELGHTSLAVTQTYLADVNKPKVSARQVANADFVLETPKPKKIKRDRKVVELRKAS